MCSRKSSAVLLWKSGKSSAFIPVRQSAPGHTLYIYSGTNNEMAGSLSCNPVLDHDCKTNKDIVKTVNLLKVEIEEWSEKCVLN